MTIDHEPEADLARVHYLPAHRADTSTVEADTEVIEAEIVTEAEYRARQRELAIERYRGYRNDIVTVGRGTRTAVRWTMQKGRDCADSPIGKFARRHATYFTKGVDAERQRKKAERGQADARAARARALEQNDLELAARLNEQIQQTRHTRVDALTKWVELTWSAGKKAALALVIALGVALVAGVINGFGHWLGAWNVVDVLHTLGSIITTTGTIVGWSVAHWWAFVLAGLGVWGFRRWKDGQKLGEQVLPAHLRQTGKRVAYVELTENALVTALTNIGVARLSAAIKEGWPNRDTDHAWVRPPMMAEGGKAYTAKLRLPMGAGVKDVAKAKDLLAHNLGCRPQELFVDPDEDDPTVMDLYRLEPGVLREPVDPYPLLTEGTTDFFSGFPVGMSPRGTVVETTVWERNFVFAGRMGSGKSTMIKALLAGAALDPLVDIDVFVFADNFDFDPLAPVLSTFLKGDTEANVQACLEHIKGLQADLAVRGQLLVKHGITEVNREVAAKEPGLRPRIVVIEECQAFFRQDDPQERKQLVNLLVRFYSAARKYGIVLVFATPNPSDQSLPRDLMAVTSNKACGAIDDKARNNIVLGEKAHENGISALGLKAKTKDKLNDCGTLMTSGFMDTPGVVRSFYLTPEDLAGIAARGAELRGGATTPAAPEPEVRDLVEDLTTVMIGDDPVNAGDLVGALRGLAPGYKPYRELTKTKLVAALAELGIKPPSTGNLYPVDPVTVRQLHAARVAQLEQGGPTA